MTLPRFVRRLTARFANPFLVRFYRSLRECRDLRRAYRRLLEAYNDAINTPCPMCRELEGERDVALHDLEAARRDVSDLQLRLDTVEAHVAWQVARAIGRAGDTLAAAPWPARYARSTPEPCRLRLVRVTDDEPRRGPYDWDQEGVA